MWRNPREAWSRLLGWEEQARRPSRRTFSKSLAGKSKPSAPWASSSGVSIKSLTLAFSCKVYQYFGDPDASSTPAKGVGLLHLLREALATGGAHLLVLDGLERVQRQENHATGLFGQIEDPLLKGLLTRIAEGVGQTVALVTSRFPLTDLEILRAQPRLSAHRCRGIDRVGGIGLTAAHGVRGDDATLERLVESYALHASR